MKPLDPHRVEFTFDDGAEGAPDVEIVERFRKEPVLDMSLIRELYGQTGADVEIEDAGDEVVVRATAHNALRLAASVSAGLVWREEDSGEAALMELHNALARLDDDGHDRGFR